MTQDPLRISRLNTVLATFAQGASRQLRGAPPMVAPDAVTLRTGSSGLATKIHAPSIQLGVTLEPGPSGRPG